MGCVHILYDDWKWKYIYGVCRSLFLLNISWNLMVVTFIYIFWWNFLVFQLISWTRGLSFHQVYVCYFFFGTYKFHFVSFSLNTHARSQQEHERFNSSCNLCLLVLVDHFFNFTWKNIASIRSWRPLNQNRVSHRKFVRFVLNGEYVRTKKKISRPRCIFLCEVF